MSNGVSQNTLKGGFDMITREIVEKYQRMLMKLTIAGIVILVISFALSFVVDFIGYICFGAACVTAAMAFAYYIVDCILKEDDVYEEYEEFEDDSTDPDQFSFIDED